jgi:hypothetical protein
LLRAAPSSGATAQTTAWVSPAEAAALLEVFLQDVRIVSSDEPLQPPPPAGPITRPMRPEKSEERLLLAGAGDADAAAHPRGDSAHRPAGRANRPLATAARAGSQPSPPSPPPSGVTRPVPKGAGRGGGSR